MHGVELLRQLAGVERGVLQLHAAGLDLGQVEDVVEHGQQGFAGLADHAQTFALLGLELAHGHDLGHGQDAVQRRADLVAHIGQEMRLQHIGGFGGVAGLDQLVHGLAQGAVVGLQLGQQGVEAVGQAAELVVVAVGHPTGEVAAAGDVMHGVRQPVDRPRQPPGQPAAHVEGQARRHEKQGSAHGDEAGHQPPRTLGLDGQRQRAAADHGGGDGDQVAS